MILLLVMMMTGVSGQGLVTRSCGLQVVVDTLVWDHHYQVTADTVNTTDQEEIARVTR